MKLKEFFDLTMIVNLERRLDRREHIQKQSVIYEFDCNLFTAFDGQTLSTKPGKPPHPTWSTISMGNYANVLSQRAIIERAKNDSVESLLIIEDDCEFRNLDALGNYLDNVPSNWDMVYFGGNHQQPLIPIDDKIGRCQFTLTAHAVGMRRHVFDHILHFTQDANMPIDLYYAYLQKQYNVYCPLIGLATQINGYSDIDYKEVDYSTIIH